jgi:O-antigen/teichoic acid export membrane protein
MLREMVRYTPGALLPAVVTLAATATYTRLLSEDQYGRYALAIAAAIMLSAVASQWLRQSITRFLPGERSPGERRRLKGVVLGASAVVATVVAVTGTVVAGIILMTGYRDWANLAFVGALLVGLSTIYGPMNAVLQAQQNAGRHSLFMIVHSAGRFALAVPLIMVVSRQPSIILVAEVLVLAVTLPLLARSAGVPSIRWIARNRRRVTAGFGRMFAYGFPMGGWFLASVILGMGDRFIIQNYWGPGAVGIYTANYTLVAGAASLLAAPVLLSAHPFLMEAWNRGATKEAAHWLGLLSQWYVVMGCALVTGVAFFAQDVASLFLGPSFQEGYVVMPWVLAGVVAWQLGLYMHKPIEFEGRTTVMFRMALGASVLNVLLNWLLVPRFGYIAAAWTTFACYSGYALVAGLLGRGILRWRLEYYPLALGAGGVLLMALIAVPVRRVVEQLYGYLPGLGVAALVVIAGSAAAALPVTRRLFLHNGMGPAARS